MPTQNEIVDHHQELKKQKALKIWKVMPQHMKNHVKNTFYVKRTKPEFYNVMMAKKTIVKKLFSGKVARQATKANRVQFILELNEANNYI